MISFFVIRTNTKKKGGIAMAGTGNHINHKAKFSAAFLRSRYPEPDPVPGNADWVFVKEQGVYLLSGNPPALFFFRRAGKQPS